MAESFGHRFQDPGLLRQALRHRSAGVPNNERLEFLGDALVNLIVAEALHSRWTRADEGELTRARASLVRESSLAAIARRHGLGDLIELGPGELKSGGHRRDSILADALEAIVGAIHLDAGFEVCRGVVLPWFEGMIAELPVGKVGKDPKTRLQEWVQARQYERPAYTLVKAWGQDHERMFVVSCTLVQPPLAAQAEGASLRAAEQAAAELVLAQLELQQ